METEYAKMKGDQLISANNNNGEFENNRQRITVSPNPFLNEESPVFVPPIITQSHSYSSVVTPLPPPPNKSIPNTAASLPDNPPLTPRNRPSITLSHILGQTKLFAHMAKPYFRESCEGRCLTIGMLLFCLLRSALNVVFSYVLRDLWTALSDGDVDAFWVQLHEFAALVVCAVPVSVLFVYQKDWLTLRWREWMTERALALYVRNRVYYGLEMQKKELMCEAGGGQDEEAGAVGNGVRNGIDNTDQRITEDVASFTATSMTLFILIIRSSIDMATFSIILFTIYPLLLYTLFVYSTLGTALTWMLGKNLVNLNFSMQKREADFRYSLVRFRENSESIAFYAGETIEANEVSHRLAKVIAITRDIIITQRNLAFFTTSYEFLIQVLPIVVVAPLYFAGDVEFGVVSQAVGAFLHVLSDFSLIVDQFEGLTSFSASIDRLSSFLMAVRAADVSRSDTSPLLGDVSHSKESAVLQPDKNGYKPDTPHQIVIQHTIPNSNSVGSNVTNTNTILSLEQITILTPNCTRTLLHNLTLSLLSTDNLLITGPSGSGKSSLLRTISGLWSSGSGTIRLPPPSRLFFLPQRPYCPQGTLRDQVLYPNIPTTTPDDNKQVGKEGGEVWDDDTDVYNRRIGRYETANGGGAICSDEEILGLLKRVGLRSLAFRVGAGDPYVGLDAVRDWGGTLSLGEQQRLAFARVLANRPMLVVLDESTSALDMDAEDMLYRLLQDISRTQCLSYISVGHRPSLLKYHNQKLNIIQRGKWNLEGISTAAP